MIYFEENTTNDTINCSDNEIINLKLDFRGHIHVPTSIFTGEKNLFKILFVRAFTMVATVCYWSGMSTSRDCVKYDEK